MDVNNLQRLINVVSGLLKVAHEELGHQPDWSAAREGYHAYERRRREEMAAIKRHLMEREGARFSTKPGYDVSMTLAGIRSSCTGGDWGLLTNWQRIRRETAQ